MIICILISVIYRNAVIHYLRQMTDYLKSFAELSETFGQECDDIKRFARELFVWRKPIPNFQRPTVSIGN